MEKKYKRRVWLTIILLIAVYIGDIILRCHGLLALPCAVVLNITLCFQVSRLTECKLKRGEDRDNYESIVSDNSETIQDDNNDIKAEE